MNSFFRRDYLYTLESPRKTGLTSTMRYIGYDRSKREYVFAENTQPSKIELQLRIPLNRRDSFIDRIVKKYHIGYLATENYNNFEYKPKEIVQLNTKKFPKITVKEKGVTFDDIIVGKKYVFTANPNTEDVLYFLKDLPVEVISKDKNSDSSYTLTVSGNKDGYHLEQGIHQNWIKREELICKEVL